MSEVREAFHLREILQVEAARLAATSITATELADPAQPDEHQTIIEAMKAHDPVAAQEAIRAHVRAVKMRVLERF